jgi:competence protein ComEA
MKPMFSKLFAAILSLSTAAAFAATDVNRASQAELESIGGIGPSMSTKILEERSKAAFKDWSDMVARVGGIGERSAARFSSDGLTVNGAAFAANAQHEGESTMKPDSKPRAAKSARSSAPATTSAPAAKDASGPSGNIAAATDETRAKEARKREARDAALAEKKAARKAAAASAPASAAAPTPKK